MAKLTADPATQTTLAAILAKIVAAPALESGNLASILARLLADDVVTAATDLTWASGTLPVGANMIAPGTDTAYEKGVDYDELLINAKAGNAAAAPLISVYAIQSQNGTDYTSTVALALSVFPSLAKNEIAGSYRITSGRYTKFRAVCAGANCENTFTLQISKVKKAR